MNDEYRDTGNIGQKPPELRQTKKRNEKNYNT